MATFAKWIDTLVSEKGMEGATLQVEGPSGNNYMPLECLIDAIKGAPKRERDGIKNMIVRIDFLNGDVMDYFKHLAKAIAA